MMNADELKHLYYRIKHAVLPKSSEYVNSFHEKQWSFFNKLDETGNWMLIVPSNKVFKDFLNKPYASSL